MRAMPQHLLDRLVGKLIEAALNSGMGKKIGDFEINPTFWMDRLQNQKLDKLREYRFVWPSSSRVVAIDL